MFRTALVGALRIRHSPSMRVPGWAWVLLATVVAVATGCASSDSEAGAGTTGGFHGGQTGSLKPCSTPDQFAGGGDVPTGDVAFVFHTGCARGEDFSVTDSEGNPVPFQMVELDDGVVLLKTDTALVPGTYRVETPAGETETVEVTGAEPLPSTLGSLEQFGGACSSVIRLGLDDSVLPYVSLLRLQYTLDDGDMASWFEYGTVEPDGAGAVLLDVGPLDPGAHRVEVVPSLAGEETAPDSESLQFDYECPATSNDPPGGAGACSLDRRSLGRRELPVPCALTYLLLGILLLLGRWRRGLRLSQ